jgi:hypothetical protein
VDVPVRAVLARIWHALERENAQTRMAAGSERMVLTGYFSNPPDPLVRLLALPSPRNEA